MSSPYTRRNAGGGAPVAPWLITGVIGLIFAALGAAWVAAHLASADGFTVPPYGDVATTLKKQGLPGLIGTDGSTPLFFIVLCGQVVVVSGVAITVTLLVIRRRSPRDGRRAMTAPRAFRDLQLRAVAKRAIGLRPSLKGRKPKTLRPLEVGVSLGDVSGTTLYKSFEDVELVICGPRSNKTSAKVVPDILAAPGPVVATSNKPDVWLLTATVRAKKGPVFLFDPQLITYQQQRFWWNPLATVTSVESASRMASYFMREVGGGGGTERADPFFTPASQKTLRQMLLAAACSGHTLRDVVMWVATRSEEPAFHLEKAGYGDQAASLKSTLELAPETKGGIYEGVATALSCLESEALLRWVTPPSTWRQPPSDPKSIAELRLWTLITRGVGPHPTLYLLSREGEGSGRPVVAAIVGELIEICTRAAQANGGRLDPTVCMSLDEAANIVRLPELPNWYSYFGSMGLMVTVILQSREQGRAVWGKEGFDALWSAATIKTVGAGVQDADFAEYLSQLVGDHKVEEVSTSYSSGGGSTSRSLRTERIMPASEIAALPKTHALMFSAGRRTALLTLHPWYAERDPLTEQITTYSREATSQVQQAAIDYLGPDNPVAAALTAELAAGGRR
ncbi:type VI secretion protein [Saccharothrix sp. ALI-22-I]|uniref:type IV secretory system conjugative DNA transfer family protein n=1 Tax=Saccharothrix sp. ALI-22-I TaxID=1933778 RepID=UPI00097C2830|nr:type IV secretory system conjugative DNA transfer family protein [Saccharothrix sp. ALI-22-I]ONI88057.1 type VI secretion protein [Saccharothrix sp. ALI-22-I]